MLALSLRAPGEQQRFGPDMIIVSGHSLEEVAELRALLDGMGASFVRVCVLTEHLARGTLREALASGPQEAAAQPASDTPRLVLLSGMSGAEALEVVDAVGELDMEPTIFAAAVPKALDKPLRDLFVEIEGDHASLAG